MTYILGLSAYYHDSSAALIKDGEVICAVQEERFTRVKHDSDFPTECVRYILKNFKIELSEIEFDKESAQEVKRYKIPAPNEKDNPYCEKNWMPILHMPYHFVKWSNHGSSNQASRN